MHASGDSGKMLKMTVCDNLGTLNSYNSLAPRQRWVHFGDGVIQGSREIRNFSSETLNCNRIEKKT